MCPYCDAKRTSLCRCPRSDSSCANGHHWHICGKHKTLVQGESNHALDSNACSCIEHKPETQEGVGVEDKQEVRFVVGPPVEALLKKLLDTGLYGSDLNDVAERVFLDGLRNRVKWLGWSLEV